jgi:23S rRNA pseudouridine1911/1915/1917 synthase
MSQDEHFAFTVGEEEAGMRADVFLAGQIEDASRSFLQKLFKDGRVRINGQACKRPSRGLVAGDAAEVDVPPPPSTDLEPQDIPLDVIYEDDDLVVVNKQAGLVVHPAPGHHGGTLVNALLHHCPAFSEAGGDPGRPGIVHRIDRDTSGLLVVAKSPTGFTGLGEQVRAHAFDRRYAALVQGEPDEEAGRIDATIGRSMTDRKKMSVTGVHGREAVTRFEVRERLNAASLLALTLETGRTHQIRVHLRYIGRPILGDAVYGTTDFSHWPVSDAVREAFANLHGQALHAERLGFTHPRTGQVLTFEAPLPEDFAAALAALRAWHRGEEG